MNKLFSSLHPSKHDVENNVVFKLFTRKNMTGEMLKLNDTVALLKSAFNFSQPTKIITHGYWNSGDSPSCKLIQKGYLNNDQSFFFSFTLNSNWKYENFLLIYSFFRLW